MESKDDMSFENQWNRSLSADQDVTKEDSLSLLTIKKLNPGSVVMQLGGWNPRATEAISLALIKSGGTLHLIQPDSEFKVERAENSIRLYESSSEELASNWAIPLDALYIHGSESYPSIRRDIFNYAPFVKLGGWIVFCGVGTFPRFFDAIEAWMNAHQIRVAEFLFSGETLTIKLARADEATFSRGRLNRLRWALSHVFFQKEKNDKPLSRLREKVLHLIARCLLKILLKK